MLEEISRQQRRGQSKMDLVEKRDFSDKKRKELADKGHALPDGSFPIENTTDLHNAIQTIGRAKDYSKAKTHIVSRARALGAIKMLPEDWKVTKFIDEVKDAFEKAIGTSSSVDQERDERSVENYVRQSANTDTKSQIGGSIVSNTTEPDPKGDIAVQKDLPTPNQPASTDLVDQATRPVGDVSVADAANQTPDVSTGGAGVYKAGMTCPDCHQAIDHKCAADSAKDDESKVEKAAAEDEVSETSADDETVEKAANDAVNLSNPPSANDPVNLAVNKSLWGGAFAPVKP
jgi:hypothetical protein